MSLNSKGKFNLLGVRLRINNCLPFPSALQSDMIQHAVEGSYCFVFTLISLKYYIMEKKNVLPYILLCFLELTA